MNREEIKLLQLEKGLLWPYHKGKKALSASTLTRILREIKYSGIPEHILLEAAERGKKFHKSIQDFVRAGVYDYSSISLLANEKANILEKKVFETINFLRKTKLLSFNNFSGSEKLHYVFYKGELLATYIDLEFRDFIVELKSNSIKIDKLEFNEEKVCTNNFNKLFSAPLTLLIFEIQLLIQYLCTGKNIYLLWSTGKGIIFNKFQISQHSLGALDALIDLVRNKEVYSLDTKKKIIEEIVDKYYNQTNDLSDKK